MITPALFRHQRSEGSILLSMGPKGVRRMREAHSAKVRVPQASHEAILINTGGGLAGGDKFSFDITAEAGARLTVTSQAAERVYRSLGDPAVVEVRLRAEAGASLMWLPQESILFDGSALTRQIEADLDADARFLAVESIILGREAMGETVHHARLRDRWRVRQEGRLIFADDLAFDGAPPATLATLGEARAFATVVLVSPDAENLVEKVRDEIGASGSASAWSGKLVARIVSRDGFELRKSLIPALTLLAGGIALPKVWTF
ncbi:urease accessory protein UreD [Aestuariivirga sp.]|uniref:urease accessory protein UreD n=1 Tax=Aestuariivirga sp. TaxID=2650926 RepID=UPI0035945E79